MNKKESFDKLVTDYVNNLPPNEKTEPATKAIGKFVQHLKKMLGIERFKQLNDFLEQHIPTAESLSNTLDDPAMDPMYKSILLYAFINDRAVFTEANVIFGRRMVAPYDTCVLGRYEKNKLIPDVVPLHSSSIESALEFAKVIAPKFEYALLPNYLPGQWAAFAVPKGESLDMTKSAALTSEKPALAIVKAALWTRTDGIMKHAAVVQD